MNLETKIIEMEKIVSGTVEYVTLFSTVKIDKTLYSDVLVGISDGHLIIFKPRKFGVLSYFLASFKLDIKGYAIKPSLFLRIETIKLMIDKKEIVLKDAYEGSYLLLKKYLAKGTGTKFFTERSTFGHKCMRKSMQLAEKTANPIVVYTPQIVLGVFGIGGLILAMEPDSNSLMAQVTGEVVPGVSEELSGESVEIGIELAENTAELGIWDKVDLAWDILV